MAHRSCHIFCFQTHFRSVQCKGLPASDDTSNSEKTSYHDFEKNILLSIFRTLYQHNLRLSFLDYEPNLWENIHLHFFQVQLDWSCRNLSLSTEHLFWIRFHRSAKWLSLVCTWPSLCISILVFFLIFKLIVFNKLNENVFITLMKSKEVKKIGNCCCLVLFFIKFIELRFVNR